MIETKEFKFVRNMLWPVKSTIEISEKGITNKGKLVRWEDITEFSYGITSINRAMNYIFVYKDKSGKRHQLNYVVAVTGKKSKKEMFAEVYWRMDQGFTEKIIEPRSKEFLEQIDNGKQIELAKCKLNEKGIEIRKGLVKKESVFIPWENVQLSHPEGSGGFMISKGGDKKANMLITYQGNNECRFLEHVVNAKTTGFRK